MNLFKSLKNKISGPRENIWKEKLGFTPEERIIDTGWNKAHTFGYITVPANMIYGRIRTKNGLKIIPLENTPHYKWIKNIINNEDAAVPGKEYYEYSKIFFPDEDPDKQMQNIKKMAISFRDNGGIEKAAIIIHLPSRMNDGSYRLVLYDGTHRAAIAKILGHEYLKCHLVKEKVDYDKFA